MAERLQGSKCIGVIPQSSGRVLGVYVWYDTLVVACQYGVLRVSKRVDGQYGITPVVVTEPAA